MKRDPKKLFDLMEKAAKLKELEWECNTQGEIELAIEAW